MKAGCVRMSLVTQLQASEEFSQWCDQKSFQLAHHLLKPQYAEALGFIARKANGKLLGAVMEKSQADG
jgi:hypothetical protein